MGFCSWISSRCSSVVSTVNRVASSAWEKTKEIASDAISWLADEAEAFVGSVKEAWKEIKPYLVAISPYLKMAAKAVATSFPWLSGAILILDKTLQALLALENSPILKKIEKAIQWTIAAARKLKDPFLTPEEVEEAKERKATFRQAAEQMSGEEARALELAAMINDYALVQTAIKNIFETNSIKDFDHYLRLRATQKLLANVEKLLTSAQSIEDISNDDIFMLGVGAKLLAENPDLSDADVIRLDAICVARFNKKLIPFVFEEMVMAWSHNLSQRENDWTLKNKDLAKEVILLRRLEIAKKLSELALDEETVFADLSVSVAEKKKALDALAKQNREMKNYVYAAEGFLQLLEKSEAELDAADQHYLIEEGGRVGMIIINCAQHGTPWEELTGKEQSLIIDFANIFEQASQERAKQLIEVMAA